MTTRAFVATFAVPLTAPESVELETLSSELRFLFNEYEVPLRVQLSLLRAGYSSINTFAVISDDRPGFRTMVAADLALDATEAALPGDAVAKVRLVTTQLVASWMAATQRSEQNTRSSAEQRNLRLPVMLWNSSLRLHTVGRVTVCGHALPCWKTA
jgi:hypothetical protein